MVGGLGPVRSDTAVVEGVGVWVLLGVTGDSRTRVCDLSFFVCGKSLFPFF